jgi:RNA polymerase sigma-70 factor (ECF subfamily)
MDKQPPIHQELRPLLPRLHYFAAALTGSKPAALDLTKSICQAVLSRAAREKGQSPLALWALCEMHASWIQTVASKPKHERDVADPELYIGLFESRQASAASFAKFVANLPAQQRGALTLVYGLGLSYDEAAEVYGVHVSTIMTRLVRCHKALARWMEVRGLGETETLQAPRFATAQAYEEQAA